MTAGHPVAEWLLSSRTSQINPATKRPWSQDYFLARLEEETGWTPFRSNYSKYENGKLTPRPETLGRFVAFWEAHGVAGPAEPAPAAPESDALADPTDKLIAALLRQAEAIEALTKEMREAREKEQDVASAIFAALEVLRPGPTPGGGGASTARAALRG